MQTYESHAPNSTISIGRFDQKKHVNKTHKNICNVKITKIGRESTKRSDEESHTSPYVNPSQHHEQLGNTWC